MCAVEVTRKNFSTLAFNNFCYNFFCKDVSTLLPLFFVVERNMPNDSFKWISGSYE